MCNGACLDFARANLTAGEVRGKDVLDVGAMDVNGSVRSLVEALGPATYLGVDAAPGKGVDEVCDVGALVARFGDERFDVVVSTEMLEHVADWRVAVSNLKRMVRRGGVLLLTTRSRGFPLHGFPDDHWRYEWSDIRAIFADMVIEALDTDSLVPGVLVKARKPSDFVEADLSRHRLYSMSAGRRVGVAADGWAASVAGRILAMVEGRARAAARLASTASRVLRRAAPRRPPSAS
jgi:SAM-dependent methyltransferase